MIDLAEWCEEFAKFLETCDHKDGINWDDAAGMQSEIDNFRAVAMRLRAFTNAER